MTLSGDLCPPFPDDGCKSWSISELGITLSSKNHRNIEQHRCDSMTGIDIHTLRSLINVQCTLIEFPKKSTLYALIRDLYDY